MPIVMEHNPIFAETKDGDEAKKYFWRRDASDYDPFSIFPIVTDLDPKDFEVLNSHRLTGSLLDFNGDRLYHIVSEIIENKVEVSIRQDTSDYTSKLIETYRNVLKSLVTKLPIITAVQAKP